MATTVGDEFQINTHTDNDQGDPSITSLSDGGFVVTWESEDQDGDNDGIYGQRYDATGAPTGDEFQINTYTDNDQSDPSVTGLSDGGFVVTWGSEGQDGDSNGIYGQQYDATGAPSGGEFQVNTDTDSYQGQPSVASLGDGGFIVTWESVVQNGDGYGIFGQRYDAAGAPLGDQFPISSSSENTFFLSPSVTSLSDGGFIVTWGGIGEEENLLGIYGQRYDASGAPSGDEFQLSTFASLGQGSPSVTSLNDGGFVVTFQIYWEDGDRYEVYGQRYDANGIASGDEFQVNTNTDHNQTAPSVTGLSDGGFVVTWQSEDQDGDDYGIYGQRYDATGAPTGDEFQINTYTEHTQDRPSVTSLSDGGFVVTWRSFDGDDTGIYGQIFSADDTTDDGLTDAQVSELSALWDIVVGLNGIYGDFASGLVALYDQAGGKLDNPDLLDILQEADIWETFSLDTGTDNSAALQDFLVAAGQLNSLQEFLEFSQTVDVAFGISALDFFEALPDVIDTLDFAFNGIDAILTMIQEYDVSAGYEALDDILTNFAAGGLATLASTAGLTGAVGGILTAAGVGTVFAVGGSVIIIGLGTAYIANEVDEAFDISGKLENAFSTFLIEIASGVPSLTASTDPLTINGNHFIVGGRGNDVLSGNEYDDTINASSGDDSIDGGAGADEMHGGAGNDTYFVDNLGDEVIEFEWDLFGGNLFTQDIDIVYSSVDFSLGTNVEYLYLIGETDLIGTGNRENNLIVGNDGSNTLYGANGYDILKGGLNNDVLYGENGADTLLGQGGNDTLYGGDGTDSIDGGSGSDTISGGNGADNILGGVGNDSIEGGNGKDTILGGTGHDTIGGGDSDDTIYGDDGNDTLNGNDGSDGLFGGVGEDVIVGGDGNDTLKGGDGNDELSGGSDKDQIHGNAGDDAIDGGAGNDTISGGAGIDIVVGGSGNDTIDGGGGGDTIQGGSGNDTISSGVGDDTIDGGSGKDNIDGEGGDDTINAGSGKDTIYAGSGADVIDGGASRDHIYLGGDLNSDTVVLTDASDSTANWHRDVVYEFDSRHDVFDFTAIDADEALEGHQGFDLSELYGSGIANGIWVEHRRNGDIRINGDVDGDGSADFQILLDDVSAIITADHFVL